LDSAFQFFSLSAFSREADFRGLALRLIFNLEKLGRNEAEHAGENHIGEGFAVVL